MTDHDEPWDNIDYILGKARDALAVIGAFGHQCYACGQVRLMPCDVASAIAAARVQENERCVQALEALWHSNDDSTKKCINAIRALIGKEST
jgi:hypothetical protein